MKLLARLSFVLVALLLLAGPVSAQMREFTGRIDRINNKKMIVDNRKGDKLTFIPADPTEVVNESGGDKPKTNWDELSSKDWVTVSWKFVDNPRKAYKVVVIPSREDEDED